MKPPRPLDHCAVEEANKALWEAHKNDRSFWKRHPDGRLTLSPSDYKLRKEWMAAYKAAVATASGTSGGNSISGVASCAKGHDGGSASDNITPPAPSSSPSSASADSTSTKGHEKQPEKNVKCKLTSASVTCQHGRAPSAAGELEVVAVGASDTITCKSTIAGTCGAHPLWDISGRRNKQVQGTQTDFFAIHSQNYRAVRASIIPLPVWLGDIEPWEYWINVGSCSGASRTFHISAYPADEISIKLTGQAYEETVKPILEKIEKYLHKLTGIEIKVEFLKGGFEYSAKWAEDKSYRCYYNWKVADGFFPLIGIKGRFPLAETPPALSDLGEAGIFIQFTGEANIKLSIGQNAPDQVSGKGEAEGKVQVGVAASLFILDEDFVSAEAFGFTGITAGCEAKLESPPKIEVTANWSPLRLKFSYTICFVAHEHEVVMFNDIELGKWEVDLFDEPAGAD